MLDPVLLASLRDLEFVARVTVEGALSGLHRSPFHGYSAEFSQYRHYRPGDDLKYVDWKLLARTDRIYTKQFRETTNARVQIVLDGSASMGYRGVSGAEKMEYARMLAGALAYLVVAQGDAVGLSVYGESMRSHLSCRPGRTHLRALLATLWRTVPHGRAVPAPAVRRVTDLFSGRGVLFVISDLYDDEEGLAGELRRAARIGHDVTVVHLLTDDEVHWRWGDVEAQDSETGVRVSSTGRTRSDYEARARAFMQRWRERCSRDGLEYLAARTDVPLEHTLRRYLLQRGAGRGRI